MAMVDDFHAFWQELPNYNPQGVQSLKPGFSHAADATALFTPHLDEDSEQLDSEIGRAHV